MVVQPTQLTALLPALSTQKESTASGNPSESTLASRSSPGTNLPLISRWTKGDLLTAVSGTAQISAMLASKPDIEEKLSTLTELLERDNVARRFSLQTGTLSLQRSSHSEAIN